MFSSPGMPKTYSTPSASRQRTSSCATSSVMATTVWASCESVATGRRPLRAGVGVVHLDACLGDNVPDLVGGLIGRAVAKSLAQRQQGIDQRTHDVVGIAEAVGRGVAEPDHQAAQDVAGEVGALVLLGVGGPVEDGRLEVEDRLDHGGCVPIGLGGVEPRLG